MEAAKAPPAWTEPMSLALGCRAPAWAVGRGASAGPDWLFPSGQCQSPGGESDWLSWSHVPAFGQGRAGPPVASATQCTPLRGRRGAELFALPAWCWRGVSTTRSR